MKTFYILLFAVVMVAFQSVDGEARVVCPRVTSEHNADLSDWKRFRNFHQWKDKSDRELALAVWKYLCDYETGVYHFNEILEGEDPFNEYATVRDPQKILNIYNMAYCGIFGPVLDGIFQNIGFEGGRSFGIDLWNHCATEVKYGGQWHYFDLDVRGLLLDEEGEVISLQEAKEKRTLWVDPPKPIQPFFPNDPDKNKVYEIYRDSRVNYNYRWFEGSHTMDYVLRQGESFTRWWTPQGGRWNHRPRYNKTPWIIELILREPKGMKPNHRHFTRWNHGNGLFQYAPNLTDSSTDFEDGVYSVKNLEPGPKGLQFINDGEAEAVFEVFTPYIIVAKINDILDESDDVEASQIILQPDVDITLSLSMNQGRSWEVIKTVENDGSQCVDLTRWVKGSYGYLVKFSMRGDAGQTALRSMEFDTWVQVAPISLPRLKQGINRLRYDIGDHFGNSTEPVLVKPNTADPDDLKNYLLKLPDHYDPQRHTNRIRGDAVLHLRAPKGKMIRWLDVGATFRTHQGDNAVQTDNRIAYAVNEPEAYQEIFKAAVPTWVNHWRYNWDSRVVLDQPAKDVFVKYTGDPGLNIMRACLHVEPKQPTSTRVIITHGYRIDDDFKTETVRMDEVGEYTIQCDAEPENTFITIEVQSK